MTAENTADFFVVDSSYILCYLLPDEHNDGLDLLFKKYREKTVEFISTSLLPYEVMNGLKSGYSRKRLTKNRIAEAYTIFELLTIPLHIPKPTHVLNIALQYNISCYDAAYIALSFDQRRPLLTFDTRLEKISRP